MTKLFSPYTIRNITLKNRIVLSPMATSAAKEDGVLTQLQHIHYVSRAIGQVGLVFIETTAISPEGRGTKSSLGIWNDRQVEAFKQLTTAIKAAGSKAGIQLSHNGRKSVLEGPIHAPSPIAFNDEYRTPQELTKDEIAQIVEAFKRAVIHAQNAGFEFIEIHAAHGYLINQFLSPLTNHRNDEYGGSVRNRYRFLQEIVNGIRSIYEGPLFVRISASEYNENGLNIEDYIEYSKWLYEQGVDLIDVSSGGVLPTQYHVYPGYQIPFSEAIRNKANVPTGAVGLITSGIQAEEVLQNGRADLIFIGRALLENPYWALKAAKELGTPLETPKLAVLN